MIQIRSVSDLRNKFSEIEAIVASQYIGSKDRKNGILASSQLVMLSLEEYARLTDSIEMKLDEADRQASKTEERLSHEKVFYAIHGK